MEDKEKLVEEQGFTDGSLHLVYFDGVRKFKSVNRAFRRGHVTNFGYVIPSRPFHNRKNTCKRGKPSRRFNEDKKRAFYELRSFNNSRLR